MPCLVGRAGREKLFNRLADSCEIVVGDNGRCERDARKCTAQLYSRYRRAMRTDFSPSRPAHPILYFDGTGGSLGKGITHAEIGTADFTGDCKQSRATLSPLAAYTGNDHALPLRRNLSFAIDTFNKLADDAGVTLDDGTCLPCEPLVVGDMQGVKCIFGMSETCHSVWCKCRKVGGFIGGVSPQHMYGDEGEYFATPEEMQAFFDEIGCEFKEEDFILANAHLSKGLVQGGRFTPFTCPDPDCGYSPTAAQAKADLARFNALTDLEQKNERREHIKGGKHWHVEKYMGPMPRGLGMVRCGVDGLHLVYLNFFKHLFKYTIHEPLPESQKKIVAIYLKEQGFYSYDAADEGDDPVKRWIGREVKRFLHESDQHLPFLLRLAAGQIDLSDDSDLNDAGEEVMDVDGGMFAPSDDEVENEESHPTLLVDNAVKWDNFLEWVSGIEHPWTENTDLYRNQRALRYCNGARRCSRDLKRLKPTLESWVPHIACNIVPRQIILYGDPTRRSADACESYGACCKRVIKHLTCRREISGKFARGYVEQMFRRNCVSCELRHGVENEPFLQRKDHRLLGTGMGSAALCSSDCYGSSTQYSGKGGARGSSCIAKCVVFTLVWS